MKLDDGKPWFRRWWVFARKPITREGKLVVNFATAVCGLSGVLILVKPESIWVPVVIAVSFVTVFATIVISYWKTEEPF